MHMSSKVMRRYIYIMMCFVALSCERKFDELEIVALGCAEPEVTVGHLAGDVVFDVVSDGEYTVSVGEGDDWLHLEGGKDHLTLDGDGPITVSHDSNRSVARRGSIYLRRATREVELVINQTGILSQMFEIEVRNHCVSAAGGNFSSKVTTMLSSDEIALRVEYMEPESINWLDSVRVDNNYLKFNVLPNGFMGFIRHAAIVLEGPDKELSGRVQITQTPEGFEYSSTLSVPRVKTEVLKAGSDHAVISEHILLEGAVINDNSEGNGAENRNISTILQDLKAADRTLYISDEEGSHGIRVDFVKGSDLLVNRFDRVRIDLYGSVLTRYEDPTRYVISGLKSTAVISNEPGAGIRPVRKSIGELCDDDVYTLRTLMDCEIPIRKGPYIPYELTNYHLANKYPMVIRDINGDDMHMVINTTCTWHRDGEGMPEGSGTISGVIVHEHCDQFEWDPVAAASVMSIGEILPEYVSDLGDIGRYQIRPITRADVALNRNFADGFSELLCEFRYFNKTNDGIFKTADSVYVYSTYPPTADPALSEEVNGRMSVRSTAKDTAYVISGKRDWTLVGPSVDGRISDGSKGNGVNYYQAESAVWNLSSGLTPYGTIDAVNGSAWHDPNWTTKKYWMVEFSTKGLEQSRHKHMSVQFGTVNSYGDRLGAPRYWSLEYSLDAISWKTVEKYTVPDFPVPAGKCHWNCPGHKYMTFSLDNHDVWDKEVVYLRMVPDGKKCGTSSSYDSGIVDGQTGNSLNYFAIRYNK